MDDRLPLSTLLSLLLVAFTIEADNEFERRVPHFTTTGGLAAPPGAPAVWLTSLVMWFNFMRYVSSEGTRAGEIQSDARITDELMHVSLAGMERWGYIDVVRAPSAGGSKAPRAEWLIRPKAGGRNAQEAWVSLIEEVEARWVERFGVAAIERVRHSLASAAVGVVVPGRPDFVPIARYQARLNVEVPDPSSLERALSADAPLPVLLSRVLVEFALEFERRSGVSLAISATALRVIRAGGVPAGDLPSLAGLSKELTTYMVRVLEKSGYAEVRSDLAVKGKKRVCLTDAGIDAQSTYRILTTAIEDEWRDSIGDQQVDDLREAIDVMVKMRDEDGPRLSRGVRPHDGGWRSAKRYVAQTNAFIADPLQALPHHPVVSHRGGFPDGS